MFPTGVVGVTLLVLRIFTAAAIVVNMPPQCPSWVEVGAFVAALFLTLGLLTPCISLIAALVYLGLLATTAESRFQLFTCVILSGSFSALGPGAYSLDSRIFGRKLLEIPSKSRSTSPE